jgi:hypothetical protein
MRSSFEKTVVAAVAALGMATAIPWRRLSRRRFSWLGWRRAGWGGGWRGGCWNCGWGWGWDPGWAIAAAAVPVGVAIASQPAYGDGPGCWVRRRVWTGGGHYLGRRLVNICY